MKTPGAVRWASPAILIAVGAVMLAWTWGKWPDVLVDFGRELYVAWQIAEGKVLYRDIAYVQGPLSPHVNALWFMIFGASVRTLVFANLAILILVVALLYRLLREISNRLAATTACVVFLGLFAFVQYGALGNFNYVCPYRHEVTHGMALALAVLSLLAAYMRRARLWLIAGMGFCTGLLALTKAEFFVAVSLALAVSFVLMAWHDRPPLRLVLRGSIVFILAAGIPILASFGLLVLAMPASEAFRGLLGSWPATFDEAFRSSQFVKYGMGTDDLLANSNLLMDWTGHYAVVFGAAAMVSLMLRTRGWFRPAASAGLVVLFLASLRATSIHWAEAARPFPLLMLLLAIATFAQCLRRRSDPGIACRIIPRLALTVFAGVLLGKMALNARIFHYGFVLAMPATMVTIVMLLDWIPAWIERRGGFNWAFRAIALAALILMAQWYLSAAAVRLRFKNVPVGEGPNAFLADPRGTPVNEVLARLREPTSSGGTLLVLPQGVMLNFLSRRANPTPFVDFVPTEFFYYGEERVLAAITERPPEFVALAHCDTSEFGFRYFGQDYGQRLAGWIQSHYHEVALAGERPFADGRFGILLLRRNE